MNWGPCGAHLLEQREALRDKLGAADAKAKSLTEGLAVDDLLSHQETKATVIKLSAQEPLVSLQSPTGEVSTCPPTTTVATQPPPPQDSCPHISVNKKMPPGSDFLYTMIDAGGATQVVNPKSSE